MSNGNNAKEPVRFSVAKEVSVVYTQDRINRTTRFRTRGQRSIPQQGSNIGTQFFGKNTGFGDCQTQDPGNLDHGKEKNKSKKT